MKETVTGNGEAGRADKNTTMAVAMSSKPTKMNLRFRIACAAAISTTHISGAARLMFRM
jgi:hypothetical protein